MMIHKFTYAKIIINVLKSAANLVFAKLIIEKSRNNGKQKLQNLCIPVSYRFQKETNVGCLFQQVN